MGCWSFLYIGVDPRSWTRSSSEEERGRPSLGAKNYLPRMWAALFDPEDVHEHTEEGDDGTSFLLTTRIPDARARLASLGDRVRDDAYFATVWSGIGAVLPLLEGEGHVVIDPREVEPMSEEGVLRAQVEDDVRLLRALRGRWD